MKRTSWIWVCTAVLAGMVACATDEDDDDGGDRDIRCGDNVCNGNETPATCARDCDDPGPGPGPNPMPVCNNRVCETGETTSCPADCPASLVTVNNSSYTVFSLYVAACGATAWGVDQLGANTIPPGSQFTLTGIPPGCWQLRGETQGATRYWQRFNVQFAPSSQLTWTLGN